MAGMHRQRQVRRERAVVSMLSVLGAAVGVLCVALLLRPAGTDNVSPAARAARAAAAASAAAHEARNSDPGASAVALPATGGARATGAAPTEHPVTGAAGSKGPLSPPDVAPTSPAAERASEPGADSTGSGSPSRPSSLPVTPSQGGSAATPAEADGPVGGAAATTVVYVVKEGDTLWGISQWFHMHGYDELYRLNKATLGHNPALIRPGQQIVVTANGVTFAGLQTVG